MSDTPKPRREWRLLEERGDKTFIGPLLVDGDEAAQETVVSAAAYDELQREKEADVRSWELEGKAHEKVLAERDELQRALATERASWMTMRDQADAAESRAFELEGERDEVVRKLGEQAGALRAEEAEADEAVKLLRDLASRIDEDGWKFFSRPDRTRFLNAIRAFLSRRVVAPED